MSIWKQNKTKQQQQKKPIWGTLHVLALLIVPSNKINSLYMWYARGSCGYYTMICYESKLKAIK